MKIACIGGGPAGLYLGILVKRAAPEHEVVVYERNRPLDTFGFGVVFSDATLGHLAEADPETHAAITAKFARWDAIEVHVGGEVLRSTGHGFCGLERKELLAILEARARALGVQLEFEHAVTLDEVSADLVVVCDGAGSAARESLASVLGAAVDVRPNKFVWLGTTVPYDSFTFLFEPTEHGLFRVHAYRYHPEGSTFIVECREDTWRAAGLADTDEDGTVAILERIFAKHLGGHHLVKNRSIWRSFPTVRCSTWSTTTAAPSGAAMGDASRPARGPLAVLVGDAAHTAHFSIGSGTKLAMEDAIALRDEVLAHVHDVGAGLAAYETRRRPEVEALQAAAQASLEWFEGTERYLAMTPVQFTYSLMTRSLRVSHQSMQKRDPELARRIEAQLAAPSGAPPGTAPSALPFPLPGPVDSVDTIPSRRVRMVDDELRAEDGTVIAKRVLLGYVEAGVEDAIAAARDAGIRGLLIDAGPVATPQAETHLEALPAGVAAARAVWPAERWLGAVVRDRIDARAAVVGLAAQLVRAGAILILVEADTRSDERLGVAAVADRIRNELGVATCIAAGDARPSDLDAAIAAGRCDLVVVA